MHEMTDGRLGLRVKADGAELCALWHANGAQVLWPGVEPWPRHAPNLFPFVGELVDGTLRHRGKLYRGWGRHGFARDRRFAWEDRTPTGCRLSLREDAESLAKYPFAFRFEIAYALGPDGLSITFTVANPGSEALPVSMGAHPAFRWPLIDGVAKQAHSLTFEHDEPSPIRRLSNNLLMAEAFPTPIVGRALALHDDLFAADAIILDQIASRAVTYTAPGAPVVRVSWDDGFSQLGIWSRRDAALLCIEPWQGMASPAGFDGEFSEKPGVVLVPPGGERRATLRIDIR